ncbi:MAG: histidine kinase, partial [Actinobacteria bacterium]|nr:histidine kinase [Actinomycetota bacterium]
SLAAAALTGRRHPVVLTATILSIAAVVRGILDAQLAASFVTVLIFAFGGLALWWLVRIVRDGEAEREQLRQRIVTAETRRAVAMERNEAAARLHDSVLQSLAAIRRADDLSEARSLARESAGELRAWLRHRNRAGGSFRESLEAACRDAADQTDVTVSVAGDRRLDEPARLLIAAAAEAVRNADTHGAPPVSIYAETAGGSTTVWVADHGDGFDPDDIPPDRMGIRDSITGRLQRAGGRAHLATGPDGTEWTLTIPSD